MKRPDSENLLKKQVMSLNRHIPRKRKTLADLLEEDRPHVLGADGGRHRFKSSELKKIAGLIQPSEYKNLKLPIYIEIDTTGARIAGRLETEIVCKILELDPCKIEVFIYKPEIMALRGEFPTVTQYMFLVR